MSTFKGVTARAAHYCSGCQMHATLDETPAIQPGHRYLRHVGFPGDDGVSGERPWVLRECIACAGEREESDPLIIARACGTYCHGTTPCALPFQPAGVQEHQHACRECVRYRGDLVLTGNETNPSGGGTA
jgi:hypothetical protein